MVQRQFSKYDGYTHSMLLPYWLEFCENDILSHKLTLHIRFDIYPFLVLIPISSFHPGCVKALSDSTIAARGFDASE
jgi:hypothetical protein